MRTEDDRDVVVIRDEHSAAGWFVWGALLGAGVALLFAPASGEDTRRDLSRRARRARAATEEMLEDVSDRVRTGSRRLRDDVEDRVEDLRETAGEFSEAVREAGSSARDELERRLADARSRRRARIVAGDIDDDDEEESLA